MKLTNEFQPIRNWAEDKGIYDKGDLKTQTIKFYEEAGELAKAVLNDDTEEILDAIGDSIVVLTSVAHFAGLTVEECINEAYKVIAKRKGSMQNGTFVKE
jgi:NTP pyrophosphatase (non-canonical NTP hydrolase)